MELLLLMGMIATFVMVLLIPVKARAHCDTMDGPTAADGKKALETCNVNYALKWIQSEYEDELKKIFALSMKVRVLSPEAQELADKYFLENLVRIHRAGEGAPYEGLKPSGTPIDEKILAADRAIAAGNLSPLEGLVTPEEMHELEEKFSKAMDLKDFSVDDVEAGRAYIEAYVSFFKLAEGESHEHSHGHHHEYHHEHGHTAHPH